MTSIVKLSPVQHLACVNQSHYGEISEPLLEEMLSLIGQSRLSANKIYQIKPFAECKEEELHKIAELFKRVVYSDRLYCFAGIPIEDIEKTFISAARNGHVEIIRDLQGSIGFKEISRSKVVEARFFAALNGHDTVVRILTGYASSPKLVFETPFLDSICLLIGEERLRSNGITPKLSKLYQYSELAQIGNLFRSLVKSDPVDCFAEIPIKDLREVLQNAAYNGDVELVKILIVSSRFKDISSRDLVGALGNAAQMGCTEIVKIFVKCNWFRDVKTSILSKIFHEAAQNGHADTIKVFMEQDCFSEISKASALAAAAENGHIKVVKLFIASPCFKEFDPSELGEILNTAFLKNCKEVVKALLKCDGINADNYLGFILQNGSLEIIRALTRSQYFKKVSILDLRKALKTAVTQNRKLVVEELIRCERLREISSTELKNCSNLLTNNAIKDVLEAVVRRRTTYYR